MTDGQEAVGITVDTRDILSVERTDILHPGDTNPTNPDSDGDGYWDGWIGVYGVGVTDNVVLYMEHLQTGDGIEGDEIVQEQIEYHEVNSSNSHIGANIDGDASKEHSKLHMGELKFGTDPSDSSKKEVPSTKVTIAVDYYERANASVQHTYWEQYVEKKISNVWH